MANLNVFEAAERYAVDTVYALHDESYTFDMVVSVLKSRNVYPLDGSDKEWALWKPIEDYEPDKILQMLYDFRDSFIFYASEIL